MVFEVKHQPSRWDRLLHVYFERQTTEPREIRYGFLCVSTFGMPCADEINGLAFVIANIQLHDLLRR